MEHTDVAIVGGGASGLALAVRLKQLDGGISVTVIEGGERLGKKLSATGNGQGNLSNSDMSEGHYHGGRSALIRDICCTQPQLPLTLFDCLFVTDAAGRIYPSGRQASSLTDCLIRSAQRLGVKVIKPVRVTGVKKGFTLDLSDGSRLGASFVALCTGGKAAKNYGSDGFGYALAQSLGHTVTPLFPSLVQLKTDMTYTKSLKGIRAECRVSVYDGGKCVGKSAGDVLFTDYGVSGNAIFSASSFVAGEENRTLSLEFLPEFSRESIYENILRKTEKGYPAEELLSGTLHAQLGRAICRRAGGDPEKIARTVKEFTLRVTGTLGFDYAQVTRGGIPFDEVDDGLQSKRTAGLYFAGEILDIDGDCGGYNLHWAFCSGIRAAEAIYYAMK